VSLAWSGRGDAKPVAGIELHWVAPARCPGAEDVRARVSQLLGSDAGASSGERLVAEGRVVAEASGRYRLSLKVRQPNAQPAEVTRVVESTSCDGLAGAAAVILALFARGEADRAASPAAPSGTDTPSSLPPSDSAQASSGGFSPPPSREGGPSSGSTPGASPGPQASSSPPPSGARKTANLQPVARVAPPVEAAHGPPPARDQDRIETGRWRPALQGPLLASDAGVLPSLAYGAGGGVGIRVSHLVAILSGVLWAWQDDTGATSSTTAAYQRRTGELSGCYYWQYGQFEGGPCLMMTLEDVTADGSGTRVVDIQNHVSWLALGLGAQARWSLAKWAALFLRPAVSFTTSRPTFAIVGYGPLYKVPLAAVSVEVGPEWIF